MAAYVSIYDMKTSDYKAEKSKLIISEDQSSHQKIVKSIAFSSDSKNIAAIIEGGDTKAAAWEWFTKKNI